MGNRRPSIARNPKARPASTSSQCWRGRRRGATTLAARARPRGRRQCGHEPLRCIEPKIGAQAERQHRGQEMGEAAKSKSGHAREPSAHRHDRVTSSCRPWPALHGAARRFGPDAYHLEFDGDRAGVFEIERRLDLATSSRRRGSRVWWRFCVCCRAREPGH